MYYRFTQPVQRLIEELKKLPGIGSKSAQRISFHILKTGKKDVIDLANALKEAREKIFFCSKCNNITLVDPCELCTDIKRDDSKICIVEEPFNIFSIERTNLYHGLYHVLHGNLSPIKGIGPEELKLSGLVSRLKTGKIAEVILATSPTTEGNATAHFINEFIKSYNVKTTRIALGLPVGADIDYVDSVTIARSFEGRVPV